jgi:pimeloyl-ACP methyl ester carboxylesterase
MYRCAPEVVMKRVVISFVVACLAVAGFLTGPAPAGAHRTAAPARAAADRLAWTPCADGFQCSNLVVPLDYRRPSGQTITLPLVRLPAGDPARRIGSLVMNPGGPGASGIEIVRGLGPILPLELRGRFDIVGFDPRGILRSAPLRCFDTFDEAVGGLPPFFFPYTTAEENVQRSADAALAGACATHGGAILGHMSTADVARDMDSLRAAMGDARLNYLGFSYGSYLGQTYANMFPGRLRAATIDGVLDPVAWSSGRGTEGRTLPVTARLRGDRGAQATLREFFRLCDLAAAPQCSFAPNSAQRFAALARLLRQGPLVIGEPPDTYAVTYADLIGTALSALYSPTAWPFLADILVDLESHAPASRTLAAFARLRTRLGLAPAAQEEYPNYVEGFPAVLCSDSVNPTSFAAWQRAAVSTDRNNGYFGRAWLWQSSICLPWPATAGQGRYLGPWNTRTTYPVLIVGNRFDPATRYEGAVTASRLLPNSRLLTYGGWGHTATFLGNYCVDQYVARYFVSLRVPAKGTVCAPTSGPFETVPAIAQQQAQAQKVMGLSLLPRETMRAAMTPTAR